MKRIYNKQLINEILEQGNRTNQFTSFKSFDNCINEMNFKQTYYEDNCYIDIIKYKGGLYAYEFSCSLDDDGTLYQLKNIEEVKELIDDSTKIDFESLPLIKGLDRSLIKTNNDFYLKYESLVSDFVFKMYSYELAEHQNDLESMINDELHDFLAEELADCNIDELLKVEGALYE